MLSTSIIHFLCIVYEDHKGKQGTSFSRCKKKKLVKNRLFIKEMYISTQL